MIRSKTKEKRTRRVLFIYTGAAVLSVATALVLYAFQQNPASFPDALRRSTDVHRTAVTDPAHTRSDAAADALARRLRDTGGDGEGWALLARSYLQLGRIKDALSAYQQATELVSDNADLWVEYANTAALTNQRRLAGEPQRLVALALAADPDNLNALALAGMAALQAGDAELALTHWRRLRSLVPADSEGQVRVGQMINLAERDLHPSTASTATASAPTATTIIAAHMSTAVTAQTALAAPSASAAPSVFAAPSFSASIRGTVTIAPSLAEKVAASDTLYVFARAADGPAMPLAAVRTRAQGWPVVFHLDDSSAMAPDFALSRFSTVNVIARVSRLGSPTAQPGDIEGTVENISIGSEVRLILNRVVGR